MEPATIIYLAETVPLAAHTLGAALWIGSLVALTSGYDAETKTASTKAKVLHVALLVPALLLCFAVPSKEGMYRMLAAKAVDSETAARILPKSLKLIEQKIDAEIAREGGGS